MKDIKTKVFFVLLLGLLFVTSIAAAEINNESVINNLNLKISVLDGQEMFLLRDLAAKQGWVLDYLPEKKVVLISNGLEVQNLTFQKDILNKSFVIYAGRTYINLDILKSLVQSLGDDQKPVLLTSLYTKKNEYRSDEEIVAYIKIANLSLNSIFLNFNSGQKYDLYLLKGEEEVWHWSKDKFFTMALVNKELRTGTELNYEIKIPPEFTLGEYTLKGMITTNNPLQLNEDIFVIK